MATERQIAANRANAKHSTGPVTAAGKQASSQNALHHGLLSHSCIILKGEKADRFDALLASLVDEFQPTTPNEYMLIQTMAVARWRQVRTWTIQTATIELETASQDQAAGSPPVIAALAFRALADHSQVLHLLQRYDTALDRQYSRALANLLKVRAARASERTSDPQPARKDQPPLNLVLEGTWPAQPEPTPELPNEPNLPEATKPKDLQRRAPQHAASSARPPAGLPNNTSVGNPAEVKFAKRVVARQPDTASPIGKKRH
jgi:hypothetical protein